MTGFVNTLLLVYASLSIMWEAVERVMDPPEINTENLLAVSVAGFLVNLVGIFAFEHGGHGHGGGDHGHSHGGGGHGHSHGGKIVLLLEERTFIFYEGNFLFYFFTPLFRRSKRRLPRL